MLAAMRAPLSRPWAIVAAVFVIFTVSSGLTIYCLSVYLHAFVDSGRFTIEEASFASSTFMAAGGLVAFAVGRLVDRHDVRLVISGGTFLMTAALLAVPWIDTLARLFAFHIVLGIGFGAAALLPGTTVVARWFVTGRSTAMTVAATGNSVGAIVLTPPVAMLIAALGFDGASPWLALVMALGILPLTWLVLRSWPADLGLAPVGGTGVPKPAAPDDGDAVFRAALRSRYYWAACAAFLLGMAATVGGQTHLFNLMMLREPDAARAGTAIALMAGASVAARFVAIWLLARMSNHAFVILLLVTQAIALAGIGMAQGDAALFVSIVFFGATIGNFITVQSLLITEAFGTAAYARIYGLSRVISTFGVLFGPSIMGVLQSARQDYVGAFVVAGALALAGAGAMALAGPMPTSAGQQAQG
ncbi:MAG: MFS transporter [Burkholderiaceae bacterium]|nr:MFS transporter [Burkholderiaceae bacterium]